MVVVATVVVVEAVVVLGGLDGSFYRYEVDMNPNSSCTFCRGEPELTEGRCEGGF